MRFMRVSLVAFVVVAGMAQAAPGDLDGSFGSGGKVTGPRGGGRAVAVRSDGKIYVLADDAPNVSVLRFMPDGSVDQSFGVNGTTVLPAGWQDDPNGGAQIALQPDGKVVIGGFADDGIPNQPAVHARVARLNDNGSLDASFGKQGVALLDTTDVGSTKAVAVQPDGGIAIAGYRPSGMFQVFILRFHSDGTPDAAFGNGGIGIYRPTGNMEPRSLMASPDGKLILAGFDASAAAPHTLDVVARFNANGTFDTSFGTSGVATFQGNGEYAALQSDGKIVMAGFDVHRLKADGSMDTTFSIRCNPPPPSPPGSLCSSGGVKWIAVQADGRIVLGGSGLPASSSDQSDFSVFRLQPNGNDDNTFGSVFTHFSGEDVMYGLALQPDGRIVAVGEAFKDGAVAIARLMADDSTPAAPNYEGLWWASPAGSESGWGINFAHQGDVIFATWFTYDAHGNAWWLAITANRNADGTFSGALYQTHGPAYNVTFDPSQVVATQVGTATLSFTSASAGTFSYTVNGVTQSKAIVRQVFGTMPSCVFGASSNLASATNYTDLWWNAPGGSESGWGINLMQEGTTIFGTWFTYNIDGSPLWLSVTAQPSGTSTFTGPLYFTSGPAFSAVPFNPASVTATQVGTATFTFSDGNTGTFAYTVSGSSRSKPITRQVFRSPGTLCH
jgi:uncharacterized delta-60 repeat protein